MCGIFGVVDVRGRLKDFDVELARDTMIHRGPDSCGAWTSGNRQVAFGHRRLAIIDLSPGGHQPMIDSETGNAITFNGEIYNFEELKQQLCHEGQQFRTKSDTEVLLVAYRKWGLAFLQRITGMFALALFDVRQGKVILARDRAGEKPLYYTQTPDGRLLFSSEVKAILNDASVARSVDLNSLNEYFAYGYVTGDKSMFKKIFRVLPGERLIIDTSTGGLSREKYWELPAITPELALASVDQAKENALVDKLHDLLRTAVRRQLVSDVPIGVLLSGGVDSSLISAIAAEVSGKRIRTFTVRFPGAGRFDEGPYAKQVADYIGSEHHELVASPSSPELIELLCRQFDDPIADSSMIPTFLVSREIRKHATVALGGDGGDELFGGYHRYPIQIHQDELRRRLPRAIRFAAGVAAEHFLPMGTRGRGYLMALGTDRGQAIFQAGRIFTHEERRALSEAISTLGKQALLRPEGIRKHMYEGRPSLLSRSTAVDFSTYMVDDVLVKVDRSSMLTSLEVRAPFLDTAVIEFAFGQLPDSLRATKNGRKLILRKLGERLLPTELDLQRKQGFSIPVEDWFRGEWKDRLRAESGSPSLLVKSAAIREYARKLDAGATVGERLYALTFLRVWERSYGITDIT